jgi:hypothetical protein
VTVIVLMMILTSRTMTEMTSLIVESILERSVMWMTVRNLTMSLRLIVIGWTGLRIGLNVS